MSKSNKNFDTNKVMESLDLLFPMDKKISIDDNLDTLYIETGSFFTTANLIIMSDNEYFMHVDIPKNYSLPQLNLNDYIVPYKYYMDLFSLNLSLFSLNSVKKVIFCNEKNNNSIKVIYNTNLSSDVNLTFSKNKSHISISGTIIVIEKNDDIEKYYGDLFLKFFLNKKIKNLNIDGIKLERIYKYIEDENMAIIDFNNDSFNLIKMMDY